MIDPNSISSKKKKKKKKKMDKSNHNDHPAASASAYGGGEVRRVHIIYFLSWRGRMEHPHLIRLHHYPSSNGGIRLRDVKRWLSAVRGKNMPQLFAWSYKRRYKKGYVWQDLVDEDLITPICDNQYILKGSQIPSPPFNFDEEEAWPPSMASNSSSGSSAESASPTSTDDSVKLLRDRNNHSHYTNCIKQEEPAAQEQQDSSFCSPLILSPKESAERDKEEQGDKMENPSFVYSEPSNKNKNKKDEDENPRVRKGRSHSSNMFRSLITCGAVNTNDSAMVKIKKGDKVSSSTCMAMVKLQEDRVSTLNAAKIPNAGSSWSQRNQHSNAGRKSCEGQEGSKLNNQMPVSAAYRPINGPKCSQCGKMFKPEKMHKHMKSCRGMKSLAKGSGPVAADKPRRRSVDGSYQEQFSGYYLTN